MKNLSIDHITVSTGSHNSIANTESTVSYCKNIPERQCSTVHYSMDTAQRNYQLVTILPRQVPGMYDVCKLYIVYRIHTIYDYKYNSGIHLYTSHLLTGCIMIYVYTYSTTVQYSGCTVSKHVITSQYTTVQHNNNSYLFPLQQLPKSLHTDCHIFTIILSAPLCSEGNPSPSASQSSASSYSTRKSYLPHH